MVVGTNYSVLLSLPTTCRRAEARAAQRTASLGYNPAATLVQGFNAQFFGEIYVPKGVHAPRNFARTSIWIGRTSDRKKEDERELFLFLGEKAGKRESARPIP